MGDRGGFEREEIRERSKVRCVTYDRQEKLQRGCSEPSLWWGWTARRESSRGREMVVGWEAREGERKGGRGDRIGASERETVDSAVEGDGEGRGASRGAEQPTNRLPVSHPCSVVRVRSRRYARSVWLLARARRRRLDVVVRHSAGRRRGPLTRDTRTRRGSRLFSSSRTTSKESTHCAGCSSGARF